MILNAIIHAPLSLGKGEVDSSILSGSTTKAPINRRFPSRALPFPPVFGRERRVNSPQKLGGNLVGPARTADATFSAQPRSRARASPRKSKRPALLPCPGPRRSFVSSPEATVQIATDFPSMRRTPRRVNAGGRR